MSGNFRSFPVLSGGGYGKVTQTAGTKINRLIPPHKRGFSRLMKLVYTAGATTHTLTVMRALGKTYTTADAAASQAVINIAANPGPSGNALAGSDYVAYRTDEGTYILDTVSSISSLAVTLASSLSAALLAGAEVWMFGVAADTDPTIGEAHNSLRGLLNATTTYSEELVGLFCSHNIDEPLLIQSDNASNAGVIEQINYSHTLYGGR